MTESPDIGILSPTGESGHANPQLKLTHFS